MDAAGAGVRTERDRSWESEAEEIAPGLFRWPLPLPTDGLRAVNVYGLVDRHGGLTLIDAGWDCPESRTALALHLDAAGFGIGDIDRVLVTHLHDDHFGQAAALQRERGVRTHLGEGERAALDTVLRAYDSGDEVLDVVLIEESGAAATLAEFLDRRRRDGMFRGGPLAHPTSWMSDGERFPVGARSLLAVATPGHTSGHTMFVDEEAALVFTGDHVLPHITPSIGFEAGGAPRPLIRFIQSLARVLQMPDRLMLPAHGSVDGGVHARGRALLAHHDRRLEEMSEALSTEELDAFAVARAVGWGSRGQRRFDELDDLNRYLALAETVAHLDTLVELGELSVRRVGRVREFRRLRTMTGAHRTAYHSRVIEELAR